jgi:cell wall assembly regulator SMI1
MDSIERLWGRIETWLTIHAPDILDNLLPGVDDDDIQEIEAELGYSFPEDVRASLRLHNGTVDSFADIWRLLNIDEIAGEQQMMSHIPSFKRLHWLPLASDGCGDLLCVDIQPEPGEILGQIIHFDHESVSSWVAPSFQALLSAFVDHLEAGKYAPNALGILKSKLLLFDQD